VKLKSMAMVAVGPKPGSTPITVPNVHPIKQNNRFSIEREMLKPNAKFSIIRIPL
jgi:hypothetical protein